MVILVLSPRWNVPARHGDMPNAYVKEEKEPHLDVYMKVPEGMKLVEMDMMRHGVKESSKLALLLKKSLYGLKQAGSFWSKLLQNRDCARLGLRNARRIFVYTSRRTKRSSP